MPRRRGNMAWSVRRRSLPRLLRRGVGAAVLALMIGGMVAADRFGVFGRAPEPDARKYDEQTFAVVHVHDGDTIYLNAPDAGRDRTAVRLLSVDTPELGREDRNPMYYGPRAAAATRKACAGKTVTIRLEPGGPSRDAYGRLLAWVYLPDGRLLNEWLVEQGYGYVHPRYDNHLKQRLLRLQKKAMKAGRGLWAEVTEDQLPEYYRGKLELPERPA